MAIDVSAEAVVLRRSDSGESDRRLTLLTREFGKIDVLAKGARKPSSRLAGSSEPLVRAVFSWASGRTRRFVTQVQPLTAYPRIRSEYDRTMAALALAELAAVSLPYESPDTAGSAQADVYDLYVKGLAALDSMENWLSALVWSEVKLMEAEGVHPEWTSSAVSTLPLTEHPAWVSPSAGGHILESESGPFRDRFLVSATCLIALKKLSSLEDPPEHLREAKECLRILFAFWRHVLDSRLPASESLIQGLPE